MLINEVCKNCKLTKKAVEYYIEQGLISPDVMENGYRNFSQDDVDQLKKISVLRKLGLAVIDIRKALNDHSGVALHSVSQLKDLEIEDLKLRQKLTQKLAQDGNWEYVRVQLEALENKKTILQKLLDIFPGYYGKFIVLHFAPYLNEPITTDEQQEAFEAIVNYLDGVHFIIPEDLQEYVDEAAKNYDEPMLGEITANLEKAIQNPEQYIADNKKTLSMYNLVKETKLYKQSPAYRLKELLKTFCEESGYNDVFIPAMQRLSNTYREYHTALEKADKVFQEEMEN